MKVVKFTIFIIYYTLDYFDIADLSSMHDACHISTYQQITQLTTSLS